MGGEATAELPSLFSAALLESVSPSATRIALVSPWPPGADCADLFVRCEDELMRVVAVAGQTLTVERGTNGTTAAAHQGPEGGRTPAIVQECAVWYWSPGDNTPLGAVESVNEDGTVNVRFGHPPPSAGHPILEAHYLEHLDCDELCRNAWARMVGRVPSEEVLRHLESRPGCLSRHDGDGIWIAPEANYANDPTLIAADEIPVENRHRFGPPSRRSDADETMGDP